MTLWPFQQVACHELPYSRLFVASRCSLAYCLWLLSGLLLVAVPLVASFATENVWLKESFYREQPAVRFRDQLFFTASNGSHVVGWSTQQALQGLLPPEVAVPLVRSSVEDSNFDGRADALKLNVELPQPMRRLTLLAVYDVQLQGKVSEELAGLVAVDLSSAELASGVTIYGELRLRQTLALFQSLEVRTIYASSPLEVDPRSNWFPQHQPLSVPALMERYLERNETMSLHPLAPPIWDYGPKDSFTVSIIMKVPPQLVYYVPLASEVLKFAWMQYLSFLIPTFVLLEWVKGVAFEQRLVQTQIIPQLPNLKEQ